MATDTQGVGRFIRDFVRSKTHRQVLCIGSSSGGYGALRFALEIEPDACLAFSPQTRPLPRQHKPSLEFETAIVFRPHDDIDDLGELYRARQPSYRAQVHLCQSEVNNPPEAYYWDD